MLSELTRVTRLEDAILKAQNIFAKQDEIAITTIQKVGAMHEMNRNIPDVDTHGQARGTS